MVESGWIVTASDYFAELEGGSQLEPYVNGKIEGANNLDALRAAHELLHDQYRDLDLSSYDFVTWGHSQGGHGAIWTAQIAAEYFPSTTSPGDPEFRLRGAALEAPASNLLVQPSKQPDTEAGYGMIDWDMHHTYYPPEGLPVVVGPWLFSWLFNSRYQHSRLGPPDPGAMPAFPDVGPLDFDAVVTAQGEQTIGLMENLCWKAEDLPTISSKVSKYGMPQNLFFIDELSNGQTVNGHLHGGFDKACSSSPPPELQKWCDWLTYSIPGPLGTSNLPKIPTHDGKPVPILIATGNQDGFVHCVQPLDVTNTVPTPKECMVVNLYEAFKNDTYCPDGEPPQGYLKLDVWQYEKGIYDGSHSGITGIVAAASPDNLVFQGSALEQFINGAFSGDLAPGCETRVVNTVLEAP